MAVRKKKNKFLRKKKRIRRDNKKFIKYERMIERLSIGMINDLLSQIKSKVMPKIKSLAKIENDREKQGAVIKTDSDGMDLHNLIKLIESQFLGKYSYRYIEDNLNKIFKGLDEEAEKEAIRELGIQNISLVPTLKTKETISKAVEDTTSYIDNLNRSTIENINQEINKGVIEGVRWETVAENLIKNIGMSKNRAAFISRNTVMETLGTLNKERQVSSGVELYRWQTSNDDRVRDTHVDLDGLVFSWSGTVEVDGKIYNEAVDPSFSSSGTRPGQPWNCRCVAIPFYPELDEE